MENKICSIDREIKLRCLFCHIKLTKENDSTLRYWTCCIDCGTTQLRLKLNDFYTATKGFHSTRTEMIKLINDKYISVDIKKYAKIIYDYLVERIHSSEGKARTIKKIIKQLYADRYSIKNSKWFKSHWCYGENCNNYALYTLYINKGYYSLCSSCYGKRG